MGTTGRIGIIMMVLSALGWIVYMMAFFAPAYKGDFTDLNLPGQALLATSICGVSILLGWFLLKEDVKISNI